MISGNTRVFAILADPVAQVRTPEFINRIFESRGEEAVLVPLHVGADQLPVVWQGLRATKNFQGMVVTVPHKTVAVSLCDEISDAARVVGAVNVVRKDREGRFIGDILDGEGFLAGLLQEGIDPATQRVLLLGAGGAGSAIAYSLARHGVRSLTIANRTRGKAQSLADTLLTHFPDLRVSATDQPDGDFDLVVNSTSLGMALSDPLPLDPSLLKPAMTVAEIIMKPKLTALLEAAQGVGCRIHYGEHMLACQSVGMANFMCDQEPA